jgi:molecular chaperone GrpE
MDKEKAEINEPIDDNRDHGKDQKPEAEVKVDIVSEDNSAISGEVIEKAEEAEEQAGEEEQEEEKPEELIETESERYLRLAAEFDNYRKRTSREFGEVIKMANVRLLKELIEVKDNFERALDGQTAAGDIEAYRKGFELIYNQLAGLLEKERVTPIETVGKPFDPNCHEAMMQQESDEYDEGIVCGELQKGYRLDDRILRYARVIVSNGKKKTQEEKDENKEVSG